MHIEVFGKHIGSFGAQYISLWEKKQLKTDFCDNKKMRCCTKCLPPEPSILVCSFPPVVKGPNCGLSLKQASHHNQIMQNNPDNTISAPVCVMEESIVLFYLLVDRWPQQLVISGNSWMTILINWGNYRLKTQSFVNRFWSWLYVCGTNECVCINVLSLSKEENKELKKIISWGESQFAPGW